MHKRVPEDKLDCENIMKLVKHKGELITDEVIESEVKEEILKGIRKKSKEEEEPKLKMDSEKELHNIKVLENALHDLGVPESMKTKGLEHKDFIFNEFEDTEKELEFEMKEVKKCERALHEIERNIEEKAEPKKEKDTEENPQTTEPSSVIRG